MEAINFGRAADALHLLGISFLIVWWVTGLREKKPAVGFLAGFAFVIAVVYGIKFANDFDKFTLFLAICWLIIAVAMILRIKGVIRIKQPIKGDSE